MSPGLLQDFVVGYILFKSLLILCLLVKWWLLLHAWVMEVQDQILRRYKFYFSIPFL